MEYPGSRSLSKLLIHSHLLVASIGGVALVIAFAAILLLRGGMVDVVEKSGPLERASGQLMSGLERSLAALRGWVSLDDPHFTENWEGAWKNDIRQALYRLEGLRDSFVIGEDREGLDRLKPLLDDLEESQWWVRSVAQTPGNEPATVVYQNQVGPVAEVVGRIFGDLQRLVRQPGSRHSLESMDFMISLQRDFFNVRLLVEKIVAQGDVFRENEYRHLTKQIQHRIRMADDWSSGSFLTRIKLLEQELEAFRTLADEAIGLRKSPQWNRAQHLMETETVPIAEEVTRIIQTLSGNATQRMAKQVEQAEQFTTFAAGAILVLLMAVMLSAILIALWRSSNLAQPIARLAEAARTFANGTLDRDVIVLGSLELESLSASFNDMRQRLVKSREELQNANERLEQRVAKRTAEAKRRAEELEQFAYVVSHDLKAPLRGVANLAAWLQEDLPGKLNNETREQLVLLQDRVGRMHTLIEGLLEYSRIGRMPGTEETVDTRALLDETIDSLSLPTSVVVDVAPDMPTLHTNQLLLGQVFANLVGNAIKHHGGSQARVWVTVRDAGKLHEFSVADDGPGIAPQYHQKVFMMFQTLAARDVGTDSGIGLALVKKIVEEQGGSITLDSEEGKGSTFRFTWPK